MLWMAVIFMRIAETWQKSSRLEVKDVSAYIQDIESFGPAVHEISSSQSLEKLNKNPAVLNIIDSHFLHQTEVDI